MNDLRQTLTTAFSAGAAVIGVFNAIIAPTTPLKIAALCIAFAGAITAVPSSTLARVAQRVSNNPRA